MAQDLVAVKDDLDVLTGIIDPDVKEYSFEYSMPVNGKMETGVFICRFPSLADRIKIGVLKAKALEGVKEELVDIQTRNLVYFLAYLKTLLIKTPSWFKLEQLTEMDEIVRLYEVVDAWIARFHREFLIPKPTTNSEDANSKEAMESSKDIQDATDRQEITSTNG